MKKLTLLFSTTFFVLVSRMTGNGALSDNMQQKSIHLAYGVTAQHTSFIVQPTSQPETAKSKTPPMDYEP